MRYAGLRSMLVVAAIGFALVACKDKAAKAPAKQVTEKAVAAKEAPAEEAEKPAEAPKEMSAEAVIDLAIDAAGGADVLEKNLSSMTAESKGIYMGAPYTATSWWQMPDKFVMKVHEGDFEMGHIGEQCWHSYGGVVVDCPAGEDKSGARMTRIGSVMYLFPLKKGEWTLEKQEDAELAGKKCTVVKVSGGFLTAPVTLYFDPETGLLHGTTFQNETMGAMADWEIVITGYSEEAGMKVPTGATTAMNGKQMMTEEYLETKYGVVDEERLKRPASAPIGEVSVVEQPARTVVTTTVTGPYETSIGAGIGAMMAWMQANAVYPMGPPSMLWLKDPTMVKEPAEYVTEIQFPYHTMAKLPAPPENIVLKEIPAGQAVRSVEVGPMARVAARYPEIAKWAGENGYEIAGPAAMDSFGDPSSTPPDKLVNVLWFPVTKKAAE